jgi:hypothetical protein
MPRFAERKQPGYEKHNVLEVNLLERERERRGAGGMKGGISISALAMPSSSRCVLEDRQFVIEL